MNAVPPQYNVLNERSEHPGSRSCLLPCRSPASAGQKQSKGSLRKETCINRSLLLTLDHQVCKSRPANSSRRNRSTKKHAKRRHAKLKIDQIDDDSLLSGDDLEFRKPTGPSGIEDEEEPVHFFIRKKFIEREGEEKQGSIELRDRSEFFDLPKRPHQKGPEASNGKPKPRKRNRRLSLALGQRRQSDGRLSCSESAYTSTTISKTQSVASVSVQDQSPDTKGPKTPPNRTKGDTICVRKGKTRKREISVNISPRRSTPRIIDGTASLDEATGLKGLDSLRPSIASTIDSKRAQQPKPSVGGDALVMTNDLLKASRQAHAHSVTALDDAVETVKTDNELRRNCYVWYGRLGQPNREDMKRRVRKMAFSCNVKPEDVDKMAWVCNGTRVSATAMNKHLMSKKVSDPRYSRRTPGRRSRGPGVSAQTFYVDNPKSLDGALKTLQANNWEQQAGESSCESQSSSYVQEDWSPYTPGRAAGEQRKGEVVEGNALQQMLNELKGTRPCFKKRGDVSDRSLPNQTTDTPLFEFSSKKQSWKAARYSAQTPVSILKKKAKPSSTLSEKSIQHVGSKGVEKQGSEESTIRDRNTKQRKTNLLVPVRLAKGALQRPSFRTYSSAKTRHPSQMHFDLTVVDTRPATAAFRKKNESSLVLKTANASEQVYAGSKGVASIGGNNKQLDPVVATFLGIDSNEVSGKKRKKQRPDFVQALSFFNSKRQYGYVQASPGDSSSDSGACRTQSDHLNAGPLANPVRKLSRRALSVFSKGSSVA